MDSEYFCASGSCSCGWEGVALAELSEWGVGFSLRKDHDAKRPDCGGTLRAYITRNYAGVKSNYNVDIDAGGNVIQDDQSLPAQSAPIA